MSFQYIWDSTFESLPDNNTYGYQIDDYFRQLYIAIRERMQVDHIWKIGETDGGHNKVSLAKQTVKPTAVAGYGYLYTKDVGSGVIEAFYEDEAGNEIQITQAGSLAQIFVAGVKSIFYQDTAPLGWTIQNTLDDKLLFVTKGSVAGGQTGGGVHSTGTWTQPNHLHTIAHTHNVVIPKDGWPTQSAYYVAGYNVICITGAGGTCAQPSDRTLASAGSSEANTGNGATADTWRPSAYCVIIASKD